MKFLVTGTAGFIGFFLSKRLLEDGHSVVGIDNLNDYYDVRLKEDRLKQLTSYSTFSFIKLDISDREAMETLFSDHPFSKVIHLAAQAGVRYSIENPHAYGDSNLTGFINILEGCRKIKVDHLVYGCNKKIPFSIHDNVDYPVSLYAATKKANELMAHCYSHLYGIPVTGLRFFTVIGPWGRPDMAYYKFTKAILEGKAIDVYNYGKMQRDFTFIDDIIEGIVRVIDKIPVSDSMSQSTAPCKIYNIGNNTPIELGKFIEIIEKELNCSAIKNMLPMQPGDVPITYADIDGLSTDVGFRPSTPISKAVKLFVSWYRNYYSI
jgi:UDP-glucuronate 4-epimerase